MHIIGRFGRRATESTGPATRNQKTGDSSQVRITCGQSSAQGYSAALQSLGQRAAFAELYARMARDVDVQTSSGKPIFGQRIPRQR
jgi:hypothetical protein